jgi:hypothetical protein
LDCLYKQYRIDKAKKEDGKDRTGWWTVRPEFTDGEEVTFQASVEKNVVPIDVLVKCPKLIDGESSNQVQEYLASFGLTLEAADANYQEQEIKSGEELDEELAG